MTVTSEPRDGRWAGWGLLALTVSLLIVHGGAAIVAGRRAGGTSDIGLLEAYYRATLAIFIAWVSLVRADR